VDGHRGVILKEGKMEAECEDGTVLHWEIRRSIAQACVEEYYTAINAVIVVLMGEGSRRHFNGEREGGGEAGRALESVG